MSTIDLSPSLYRLLRAIGSTPKNGRSYELYGDAPTTYAILSGIAVGRGLIRERKHRDHTRDHVLTAAGKALAQGPTPPSVETLKDRGAWP